MFAAHRRISDAPVHAVIHAAVVAYGFVFMHPFEDGNGRNPPLSYPQCAAGRRVRAATNDVPRLGRDAQANG